MPPRFGGNPKLPELKEKLLDAWEKRIGHRAENVAGIQPEEADHLAIALEHIARIRVSN
jgi:hypothetical protein